MGKRRLKQQAQSRQDHQGGSAQNDSGDAKPEAASHVDAVLPVLAMQEHGPYVAIGLGTQLLLHDRSSGASLELAGAAHSEPIRAMAFDSTGRLFMAGGDDKTVRVWDLHTCQLLHSWTVPKKVSAAAFSLHGAYAFFADKFGDVHVAAVSGAACKAASAAQDPTAQASSQAAEQPQQQQQQQEQGGASPQLLLGHFCSIVTSLALSPDGSLLVSTDKDHKVRVSSLPRHPLQGAYEIQSYCLGHTDFVTSAAFLHAAPSTLLLSGSGDGTVRLWDHMTGRQLSMHDMGHAIGSVPCDAAPVSLGVAAHANGAAGKPEEAAPSTAADLPATSLTDAQVRRTLSQTDLSDADAAVSGGGYESDKEESDGGARERPMRPGARTAAVLAVAASPDGTMAAAAIEGRDEVTLLRIDHASRALSVLQQLRVPDLRLPTAVQFDAEGRLWALGTCQQGNRTCFKLGLAVRIDGGQEWISNAADAVPKQLQAAIEAVGGAAHNGPNGQYNPQLRKRIYSEAEVAARKKNRRDVRGGARHGLDDNAVAE